MLAQRHQTIMGLTIWNQISKARKNICKSLQFNLPMLVEIIMNVKLWQSTHFKGQEFGFLLHYRKIANI